MISYIIGNILDSEADAIVNTVNCEGYMGKGIAYQFKLKYTENNKEYEKLCKAGAFKIGDIFAFNESNKIILNFPTKDKWRNKSEYSFIRKGLETLIEKLPTLGVKSIAFPPLGCGNGGLNWIEVKDILVTALTPYQFDYDFILYEPSSYISGVKNQKRIPKLNASHLILMQLKLGLSKFNKTRLQKGAFLINIFSGEEYFKFTAYNFGPYNHTIDVLSKDIKEYQEYYNFTTEQAFEGAKKTLVSESVNEKLEKYKQAVLNAVKFLNDIETDKEVELISTILYIIQTKRTISSDLLPQEFEKWSKEKADRFSNLDIENELNLLQAKGLLINSLMGVELNDILPNIVYRDKYSLS